ncbi:hypothetical protein [Streptomyces sp. CFMR 7]|nr:hypothetical protein [Streptomyces sp. CFMR 7]
MTAEEHLLTDEQLARVAAVVQERPCPWAVFASTRLPSPVGESRFPE